MLNIYHMEQFTQKIADELKSYVYALIDPRNSQIFYIGKGQGNRVFQHAADALDRPEKTDKLELIREILASKGPDGQPLKVKHYIIRHHLSENEALDIESVLIDIFTYSAFSNHTIGSLTNIQAGTHQSCYGIATTDEICRIYGADPIDLQQLADELKLNFMTININGSYRAEDEEDAIYEATRKSWCVGDQSANKVDYAIAQYHGFIVGAFYCRNCWELDTEQSSKDNKKKKRRFFSQPTTLDQTIQKQLDDLRERLKNKRITVKRGNANPIKYFRHN